MSVNRKERVASVPRKVAHVVHNKKEGMPRHANHIFIRICNETYWMFSY